MYQYSIIFTC